MKATVTKKVEVEIEKIVIDIEPRYIGNNEDDDVSPDMPGVKNGTWLASVEIDTGRIIDWPKGEEWKFYAKVCDAGLYRLYASDGELVGEIDGYVPNGIVPGDYGDYVSMDIGPDGIIRNWPEHPNLDAFFEED